MDEKLADKIKWAILFIIITIYALLTWSETNAIYEQNKTIIAKQDQNFLMLNAHLLDHKKFSYMGDKYIIKTPKQEKCDK